MFSQKKVCFLDFSSLEHQIDKEIILNCFLNIKNNDEVIGKF